MRLLLATTNPGKLKEIRPLLEGLDIALLALTDCPPLEAPAEPGSTFEENARAKALYYAAATGHPTVAEDSGLEIDALGKAPGVESARFGGVGTSYTEKFALLYDQLRVTARADRAARFVCALALVEGGRVSFEARGTVEGLIADEPRGHGGFGYDPIFFYPPLGGTLAERADRKSTVSHRADAFRKLRTFLTTRSSGPAHG